MKLGSFLLCLLLFLPGCASNPNSIWFDGAMMNYEVLVIGPSQYKLVAFGAGFYKKEDVKRGFMFRAGQLCDSSGFTHEFQTVPYQYNSTGGGFFFTHNAFKASGVVKCT
ncbi:MAG TPA: hypothetical protein PLQ71_22195 [Nitrospira sp.]|nr:hypothetical protein [Nitrospira sp.]